MVDVFNKEFLSWYLLTLKLNETVEAGVLQHPATASGSIEYTEQVQVPPQQQLQKEQRQPSDSLQEVIKDQTANVEDGPKSPESEWVINIRRTLDRVSQVDDEGIWSKLCIYRVTKYLRKGDARNYIPQIVSLGPYHHKLHNTDSHKWRAVSCILKRVNQDIQLYLDAVKELEERARACYEGSISLSSDEFVKMMVLDGCFILELFRGFDEGFYKLGYSEIDPVFSMRGLMNSIQRDMIMLENQIPLFVLDRLFGLQARQPEGPELKGVVRKLALKFFDPLCPTDEPLTKSGRRKLESSMKHTATFDPLADVGGLHCLDVFRSYLLRKAFPRIRRPKRVLSTHRVADKRMQQLIHCVTKLKESGINFKKRETDRFWDIKFEDGVLRIPRLLIHDGTRSLFLNLIAFEQFHLDANNDVTSYVILMDNLINTAEDVSILHRCGIIEHWLGSDAEVAELFNRMCQNVVFDGSDRYVFPVAEQVNQYCERRWNTWRAILYHKYFDNPWAVISIIAAVILLLLTFTQTFYGVFAYYRPPS